MSCHKSNMIVKFIGYLLKLIKDNLIFIFLNHNKIIFKNKFYLTSSLKLFGFSLLKHGKMTILSLKTKYF